jgi:hypothetical protein
VNRSATALTALTALTVVTLGVVRSVAQPAPAPRPARPADDRDDRARAAFLEVYQVLMSPRCMNCHPSGDRPLQTDRSTPHAQNISRRSEKNGVPCSTCHREKNGARPGQPPGAPHWHLPPAETPMIFEGRTPAQLCAQLKDPRQTGDRDLGELVEHVDKDALVLWGWSPGPGRTLPPLPHDRFVSAMRTWVDAGAACPP